MKKVLAYLLFSICLFLACNEPIEVDPETGFEIFTIPASEHSSIMRYETFVGQGIDVTVKFDDSAVYTLQNAGNQGDINKLIGFSNCGQHHHNESARFGWRWYENELQILAYAYLEGTLHYELMGAIATDEEVDLTLMVEEERYHFSGNGLQSVSLARTGTCESGENYWLWPYFGGNATAPHSVRIEMKREVIP